MDKIPGPQGLAISDVFGLSGKKVKPEDIPIDHLDYEFVEKCSDAAYLSCVLDKLRSGVEGRYLELEDFTEKRMLEVMDPSARSRYLALSREPSREEESEAREDLADFLASVKSGDEMLQQKHTEAERRKELFEGAEVDARTAGRTARSLPAVRGSATKTYTSSGFGGAATGNSAANSGELESKTDTARAAPDAGLSDAGSGTGGVRGEKWVDPRTGTFKDYYNKWDSFDVDAELDSMDESERKRAQDLRDAEAARIKEKEAKRTARRKQLAGLNLKVDPATMSEPERLFHARREKEKGNEYFRSNEYEDAALYYGRSLAFDGESAVVYANRSLALLRLKRYGAANDDIDRAVELDPTYIKAWMRRGSIKSTRGRHLEAMSDYKHVLELEPGHKGATKALAEAEKRVREVEGESADAVLASGDRRATSKPAKGVEVEELTDDETEEDEVVVGTSAAAPAPAPAAKSTRIMIEESDSDSSSDSEAEDGAVTPADATEQESKKTAEGETGVKKTRLAIEESDSDSEEEEEAAPAAPAPATTAAPAKGGTRLAIEESDSESDGEAEAEAASTPDPAALRQQGNDFFRAKQFEEAIAAYTACVEACEASGIGGLLDVALAALSNRAFANLKLNQASPAEADCNAALQFWHNNAEQHPKFPALGGVVIKLLFRRGLARVELGKSADATADFEAILEAEPDNARAADELGKLRAAEKKAAKKKAPAAKTGATPKTADAAEAGAGAGAGAGSPSRGSLGVEAETARRAAEAAAAAAAHVAAKAPLPPAPRSVAHFEKACDSLLKTPGRLLEYLLSLDAKALGKLLKRPLEVTTMSAVLVALNEHFAGDAADIKPSFVTALLKALAKAPSFSMTVIMLTKEEKAGLNTILDRLATMKKRKASADIRKLYKL